MRQVLTNCELFDGERLLEGHAVVIAGELIEAVVPADRVAAERREIVDIGGRLLAPGLVDLQVNGGGGVLFNDEPTAEALQTIADAHRHYGTTAFLPTLISDDAEVMRRGIAAARSAMADGLAAVIGIHFEGPHLNPDYRGVHDASRFRPLDADAEALLGSLGAGCTLVTLAPETVPAAAIGRLRGQGITVFGGHSAASYEQTREALAAGLCGFTHLFNAMTPLVSRAPGMVGAALEDGQSWASIIADGHHVHPATLRLAIRAKARGRMLLVSDAMPTVGAPGTSFVLRGETIRAEGGRCVTPDGTLAGGDIALVDAVRNLASFGGVDRLEALRMASRYPAEAIGLGATLGRVAPGYRADLIELEDDFTVMRSWAAGRMAEHR
jgi:N-acetylglucosamine-6-phosphate deacetylase